MGSRAGMFQHERFEPLPLQPKKLLRGECFRDDYGGLA